MAQTTCAICKSFPEGKLSFSRYNDLFEKESEKLVGESN